MANIDRIVWGFPKWELQIFAYLFFFKYYVWVDWSCCQRSAFTYVYLIIMSIWVYSYLLLKSADTFCINIGRFSSASKLVNLMGTFFFFFTVCQHVLHEWVLPSCEGSAPRCTFSVQRLCMNKDFQNSVSHTYLLLFTGQWWLTTGAPEKHINLWERISCSFKRTQLRD